LARTLRSADVTPDQLDAVLLVGGSSRSGTTTAWTTDDERTATTRVHRPIWLTGALVTAVCCLGLVWLVAHSHTPTTPPPAGQAKPLAPPAVLAPPRYVAFPHSMRGSIDDVPRFGSSILSVRNTTFGAFAPETLAPLWSVTLPRPALPHAAIVTLTKNAVCVLIAGGECIPIDLTTRTVEPPLRVDFTSTVGIAIEDGRHAAVFDRSGQLMAIDLPTHRHPPRRRAVVGSADRC
jgi:hypothetical protein